MAHMPKGVFKALARAQAFVKLLDEYFSIMPVFKEEEDEGSWNRKRVAIRLHCSPSGSHARIWYESCLETTWLTSMKPLNLNS